MVHTRKSYTPPDNAKWYGEGYKDGWRDGFKFGALGPIVIMILCGILFLILQGCTDGINYQVRYNNFVPLKPIPVVVSVEEVHRRCDAYSPTGVAYGCAIFDYVAGECYMIVASIDDLDYTCHDPARR